MTECNAPPAPDDLALMAYNEGEGDPATLQHIQKCAHCRARAEAIAQEEKRLDSLLYRLNCPPTDRLQEYYLNYLPPAQSAEVTAHLQSCPHCTRELLTLTHFLAADADELSSWSVTPQPAPASAPLSPDNTGPNLFERIQTFIATLMPLTPAYGTLRATASSEQHYQAGDLLINIDIHLDPRRPKRRELLGSLIGSALLDPARAPWTAHLWHAEDRIAAAPLDEFSSFLFTDLAPNDYQLIISGNGIAINVATLPVA